MITEPEREIARAVAKRLDAATEVELALQAAGPRLTQYVDEVAIGALIVSAATLAWTVVMDLRNRRPRSPDDVTRTIRICLHESLDGSEATRESIIEAIIEESVRRALAAAHSVAASRTKSAVIH